METVELQINPVWCRETWRKQHEDLDAEAPASVNQAAQHHESTMRLNWDSLLGLVSQWPESGHLRCVVGVNDEAAVTKDETQRVSHIHTHTHTLCFPPWRRKSDRVAVSEWIKRLSSCSSPVFFHLLKKQPLHFIHGLHPLHPSHVFDGRPSFTWAKKHLTSFGY